MLEKPKTVQLFHTCVINEFYPEVAIAAVNVLERLGLRVEVPPDQTCCGQPAYNSGFAREARYIARRNLQMLFDTDGHIVIPSGSCGDMIIHQYRVLFDDDPATLAMVEAVASRCYEFSQLLVDIMGVDDVGAQLDARAAYHSSCHLLRGLKIKEQPKILLQHVAGLEMVDFDDQEECCGFGGLFAVKNSDISGKMMNNKIGNIEASNADTLISCDMGCLLHLEGGLHRKGSPLKVCHLAQILDNRID